MGMLGGPTLCVEPVPYGQRSCLRWCSWGRCLVVRSALMRQELSTVKIRASRSLASILINLLTLMQRSLPSAMYWRIVPGETSRYSAALVVEIRCRSGRTEAGLRRGVTANPLQPTA